MAFSEQPHFSPAADPGFVVVEAGSYRVGKSDRLDNHLRKAQLDRFEIAVFDITNDQFATFVKASGYITDAEKRHNAMTFKAPLPEFRWRQDPTADWRHPNGVSQGGLTGKGNHPVTSISYRDAQAYCKWAKVRLPTLDEWEVACRAGTDTDYFFGATPDRIGEFANIWRRSDHLKPDYSDGYLYTSPVGSFKPNPIGLYDIYGNVFEFCSGRLPSDRGPRTVHARGGSWWCSKHACCYFNSVDIGSVDIGASFSNQGFRVAKSIPFATP